MITDKEANIVYFSELLYSKEEFKEAYKQIQGILDKHTIRYERLTDTNDIWCRDYMPIQVSQDKFVQFKYEPSYLTGYLELQSDPIAVLQSNGLKAEFSTINLDGGNVIRWTDKAILTERVFKENPLINKNTLTKKLEQLFKAEIFFIRDVTEDMTGHTGI